MNNEEMIKMLLEKQENIEQKLLTIRRVGDEQLWAQVFHDTIKGSRWLPADFPLSPGRSALGYAALYVLYRILNEVHPQNILEMGLGQSTKIISMYCRSNTKCNHLVVEHDESWISFFKNHFELPETSHIVRLDIENKDMEFEGDGEKSNVITYVDFKEQIGTDKQFDFICIDGPYGYGKPQYSRIDILEMLPDCLKDSFIIMLDDLHRKGEQNTFRLISEALDKSGIKHYSKVYMGMKHTGIVVSEDLAFLCTL